MKHLLVLLIAVLSFFSAPVSSLLAQPCCLLDLGIFNNPVGSNKLEIRIKATQVLSNGNYSAGTFTVRYPSIYGGINCTPILTVFSSAYAYGPAVQGCNGIYTYQAFAFSGFNLGINWIQNQEILVAVLEQAGVGMGMGTFELTADAYAVSITGGEPGDPIYQRLAANGMNGGGDGQQGIIYQSTAMSPLNPPLPVELTAFTVTATPDQTVTLDWTAAAEKNLAYYGLEYSTDGRNFSEFAQVDAKGLPSLAADYAYVHEKPQTGLNYYRLRLVDRDGTFEYSAIRSARLDDRKDFSLVPTPTIGPLALLSKNLDQYPAGLKYQLTDNTGKILQTSSIIAEKTDFNLSSYAAGMYYLTIFTEREQVKQFKVIVTKD